MCNFEAELHYNVYSMRFLGNIEARTDAKGRAFLPSVFRKALQMSGEETLVLRKDVFQECFIGMGDTIEIWASEAESKALLPSDEFGKALQDVLGREKED